MKPETKYMVYHFQNNTYEVMKYNPEFEGILDKVFQGTMSECEAWIRLHKSEPITTLQKAGILDKNGEFTEDYPEMKRQSEKPINKDFHNALVAKADELRAEKREWQKKIEEIEKIRKEMRKYAQKALKDNVEMYDFYAAQIIAFNKVLAILKS